ncbi:MAG: OadG family transporter subunit [Bacillota bacterium]
MNETISLGLNMTFVGIVVVFASLIILCIIISFFPILNPKKTRTSAKSEPANISSIPQVKDTRNNGVPEGDLSDDSLVAVLTAAVLASMRNRPDVKIRVTSFKRIEQTSPVWNTTGRKEYIANKL